MIKVIRHIAMYIEEPSKEDYEEFGKHLFSSYRDYVRNWADDFRTDELYMMCSDFEENNEVLFLDSNGEEI